MEINSVQRPTWGNLESVTHYPSTLPLENGAALIITGSLMSNPYDRGLTRNDVCPVQLVYKHEVRAIPYFQNIGTLGISSLALPPVLDQVSEIFFSAGNDVFSINIANKTTKAHANNITFIDVHEIILSGDQLLIANTGRDEAVIYSTIDSRSRNIIQLAQFRTRSHSYIPDATSHIFDHFHLNQTFRDINGTLHALVHHVNGRQLLRKVIGGVVKSHGDGGLINLETGTPLDLALNAPHSVRIYRDNYIVLNSGALEMVQYSSDWQKLRAFPTAGWGRGLAIHNDTAYIGISPIRKRYQPFSRRVPGEASLLAINLQTGVTIGRLSLKNIEQVNNVYCVDHSIADALLSLDAF